MRNGVMHDRAYNLRSIEMAPSPWLSVLTPSLAALAGVALGIFLERYRRAKGSKRQSLRDVVNSGEELRVERRELEAAVAACLEAAGAPRPKASLVARVLVAADCRGIPSHGVNRTEMYCGELRAGLGRKMSGCTAELTFPCAVSAQDLSTRMRFLASLRRR